MTALLAKKTLEERFTHFIESLPNSETIDKLQLPFDPERRRKADFLLGNREVIVELKTLMDDVSPKVDAVMDKHRAREDFPRFYGKADARKVLSRLPDAEDIYRRMVLSLTRSIDISIRSAEEQITHTRSVLGLPNAAGLLVILNESIQILDPTLVGHRVAQVLRRERTGRSTSDKVDFVWLLFESHAIQTTDGSSAATSMLIHADGIERLPWFTAFHHDLVARWASANGGSTVDGGNPDPMSLVYQSPKEHPAVESAQNPRHEIWRRQYRAQPYLRHLSDDGVRARGADIMKRLAPHLIKDGPGFVPERDSVLMEEFTHLLEEAAFRALDMRPMQAFIG